MPDMLRLSRYHVDGKVTSLKMEQKTKKNCQTYDRLCKYLLALYFQLYVL